MINLCLRSEFLGCRLKQISTLVEIINQTPLLTAESADSRAGSKWDVENFLQWQAMRQWPLPPDTFTPNSFVPRTQTREKTRSRNELIYTGRALHIFLRECINGRPRPHVGKKERNPEDETRKREVRVRVRVGVGEPSFLFDDGHVYRYLTFSFSGAARSSPHSLPILHKGSQIPSFLFHFHSLSYLLDLDLNLSRSLEIAISYSGSLIFLCVQEIFEWI